MDKHLIKKRFSGAWDTYCSQASVQAETAVRLMDIFERYGPVRTWNRVLEIGCGSGIFTREMLRRLEIRNLILNDLCEDVTPYLTELRVREKDFLPGDAERIGLPGDVDLLVSASALQWFDDAPGFLLRCRDCLEKDAYVLVATFAPGNLSEIRELTGQGLDYVGTGTWRDRLSDAYDIVYMAEDRCEIQFASPRDVLLHLKKTGANAVGNFRWNREKLLRFEQEYVRRFSCSGNRVRLTYRPLYMLLKKS